MIAGGYAATTLFCMGLLWVTAAMLPWGFLAQFVVCATAATSMLVTFSFLGAGVVPGILTRDVITLAVGACFSLFVASILAAERREISARLSRAEADEADKDALHVLLDAMHRTESEFIAERDPRKTVAVACASLLSLAGSEAVALIHIADRDSDQPRLRIVAAMRETEGLIERVHAELGSGVDTAIAEALETRTTVLRGALDHVRLGFEIEAVELDSVAILPVTVSEELVGFFVLV
ncbi:MAG: hypothetical protein ACI8TX_003814, partial [Hyphomicrobiaceae bacterium]